MLSLKVQRTLMSLLPWIGAVDDVGGSWLEFGTLTLILLSLFGSLESSFQIWVFYIEFEGAKNPHVPIALNWGCWWYWRFLIGVLDLDLYFSKLVWVLGILFLNFGFLCWLWRCKEPSFSYYLQLRLSKALLGWAILIFWNKDSPDPNKLTKIKVKIPNSNQEPPASSTAPIQGNKDMRVLCTFKLNIKNPNLEQRFLGPKLSY